MRRLTIAACLGFVVLCGCATANWQEGVRPWWTIKEQDFAAITPGRTKAEVERMVGKPLFAETFSRQGEDVWDYRFLAYRVARYGAEVHFREGLTTYVVTYPDRCPNRPIACP